MSFFRHPRFRQLLDFADGSADDTEAARVQEHLTKCSRCRSQLAFLWEVARVARQMPAPRPPSGTLEEILRRRAAGERVILPTSDGPPPRASRKPLGALLVIGALLTLGVSVFLLTSGEVSAGSVELHVTPPRPGVGSELAVELRIVSPLAAEPGLRLRGRYRTAEEGPPRELLGRPFVAQLARRRGGLFEGRLRLPPSAVYAIFAVEDPAGTRVETDGGRPWEVLAHHETGRPLFAALRQRYRVMGLRDWRTALETARRMTELYPEQPEGWFYRLLLEREITEPAGADSLRRYHGARLARLDETLSRKAEAGPEEMAGLARYARLLGEAEVEERWIRRLARGHPEHPAVSQRRVLEAVERHRGDPAALLGELEAEWRRTGPGLDLVAQQGFVAALSTGEPAALRRWADRYQRLRPDEASRIATDMASLPPLREEAMDRLRRELGRLERVEREGETRPLDRTARAWRAETAARMRGVLAALGKLLVAAGRVESGLDTLALAAAEGWDPELFRSLAAVRRSAGDAAGARWLAALAAADPLRPGAADPEPPAGTGAEEWRRLLEAARRERDRRILAGAAIRPLPLGVEVRDAEGRVRDLRRLAGGRVTLLAYWSRFSSPALRDLPRLERLSKRLERGGVRLLTVTDEPGSAGLARFLARHGYAFPVLHDPGGRAAYALGGWATPAYVVVDARGRIRFRHGELEDAVRQALTLAGRAKGLAGG
ncbi:MAG: redoxin domain-containing protein [Gemmatimonadota bacterium]